MGRKRYDVSFKEQACKLVTDQKQPNSDTCKKLGVSFGALDSWLRERQPAITQAQPMPVSPETLRHRWPGVSLVRHSDRGCRYTAGDFQSILQLYQIALSMSRRGDCDDNAVMENSRATLKREHVDRVTFATHEQATLSIFE